MSVHELKRPLVLEWPAEQLGNLPGRRLPRFGGATRCHCGRGLAPDSAGSARPALTEKPRSGASLLPPPHQEHHRYERPPTQTPAGSGMARRTARQFTRAPATAIWRRYTLPHPHQEHHRYERAPTQTPAGSGMARRTARQFARAPATAIWRRYTLPLWEGARSR